MGMSENLIDVLVIDDQEDIRLILKYRLNKIHYSIYEASNGEEGIKQALELIPDIILLDIMMPNVDGIEVFRILRQNPKTKDIPILVMSAINPPRNLIEEVTSPNSCFVSRPVKFEELLEKMETLLHSKT